MAPRSGTRQRKAQRRVVRDRRPLRLAVYTAIKRSILEGELASGQPLLEDALVEQYRVSKTPIREALNLLHHEGFVCGLPWRGWYVAPVTLQDMQEVFELRIILEVAAAQRAATRVTGEQLERLAQATRRELADEGSQGGRVYVEANQAFHETLAEASGNARLAKQVKALLVESLRHVTAEVQAPGHVVEMLADHATILAAVRAGDGEKAGQLMERHLMHAHPGTRLSALI